MWDEAHLGKKPERTWREAVVRYLKEVEKKTRDDDIQKLRWLDPYLGQLNLSQITREVIDDIAQRKLAEPVAGHGYTKDRTVSKSTVNRYLALIRTILRKCAQDWEWIDKIPKVRLFREPKGRTRWLTRDEVVVLMEHLPDHQRDIALVALYTGLRQSNVLALKWSQIDFQRRCAWVADTKNGEPLAVPLSQGAIEILRARIGEHTEFVFTFRGKPIANVNTKAWKKALAAAGIENFRWHDLRHTWASWQRQAGTTIQDLQDLGGWKGEGMVRRYAHLSPDHLAEHGDKIVPIDIKRKESGK